MTIQVGSMVVFNGYEDPETLDPEIMVLTAGQKYEISMVEDSTGEVFTNIPNPAYDASKPESEDNQQLLAASMLLEEVTEVEAKAKKTTKKKTTKKAEAPVEAKPEPEVEVEVEPEAQAAEETKPAPKKKTPAKKKTTTKPKKPVVKPEPEVEVETETEVQPEAEPTQEVAAEEADVMGIPAEEEDLAGEPRAVHTVVTSEEDAEAAKFMDLEQQDATIVAMIEESDDICALAEEVREEVAFKEYTLGGLLYNILKTGEYKKLDPTYAEAGGFTKYVLDHFGFRYRKAKYVISIYVAIWAGKGLTLEMAAQMGWTKASLVAEALLNGELSQDEEAMLIEQSQGASASQIKETIKAIRSGEETLAGGGEGETVRTTKTKFTFLAYGESGPMIQSILEQAAAANGGLNPDQTFEHIMLEWAQQNLDVDTSDGTAYLTTAASTETEEALVTS